MRLAYSEAMLFKYGSGTGTDLSPLRSTPREAQRRRHAQRPAVLPEGLRPGGQRREDRRQDPPRGQDEHAQGLAPRHRGIHRGQDRRRRRRPGRSSSRATTAPTTATPTARSCTRTKTSPSASATNSCRPRIEGKEWWTQHRHATASRCEKKDAAHAAAQDRRRHLDLRRPRHAVRRRPSTSGTPARAPSRSTPPIPCSRISLPQQHRLQSRLAEPDEVQEGRRHIRRRALQGRRAHLHHRAGNPRRQRQLSRPRRSRKIPTSSARSASASPTSARSS